MKLFAGILLAVAPAFAQEAPLRLYNNGIGPVLVSSWLTRDGQGAASLRNESGLLLRELCLCVRPAKAKDGCSVIQKCSNERLEPGATLSLSDNVSSRGQGLPKHRVLLLNVFKATPLDAVSTLYVETLSGGNAEIAREQVMAAVVADTSGRFRLTEDPSKADAKLTGRAETRDTGEAYSSAAHAGGIAVATLGIGAAEGSRTQSGKTEVITRSLLVLRLVTPTGETLWAWDDSKACDARMPKARCAITDLVAETYK